MPAQTGPMPHELSQLTPEELGGGLAEGLAETPADMGDDGAMPTIPDQVATEQFPAVGAEAGDAAAAPDAAPAATAETPAAQPTAAEAQDLRSRYSDIEKLGKSHLLTRSIFRAGTERKRAWQWAMAKVRNAAATPGRGIKQFAYNRAESAYKRRKNRLDEAAGASVVHRQHLQNKVNKAEDRMLERGARLQLHKKDMQDRRDAVHQNAERRQNGKYAELVQKKEYALARKAVRERLRSEGARRRDIREILADMPEGHMDRIGKLAIESVTSGRMLKGAERREQKYTSKMERTEGRIDKAGTRKENYEEDGRTAEAAIENISKSLLPNALRRRDELRTELAGMRESDPDYAVATESLEAAEREVRRHAAARERWRDTVAHSKTMAEATQTRQGELEGRLDIQGKRLHRAKGQTTDRRRENSHDRANFYEEVNVALNPGEVQRTEPLERPEPVPVPEPSWKQAKEYAEAPDERVNSLQHLLSTVEEGSPVYRHLEAELQAAQADLEQREQRKAA